MTDTTNWQAEAERLRAERDDARFEWQASERRTIEFGDILAQYIAAMRAAVLDGDAGMRWIKNTLAGPGHLPDGLGEHATAQAMFDAEVAEIEAHRAKHPIPEPVVGPLRAQIRTLTAERDAALAELARVQARGWPSTPDDVRALLGSRCGAVRYALPVPDGAFEAPPHESDTYMISAHDLITCNIAASEMRYAADVELKRVRADLAQARDALEALQWCVWDSYTGEPGVYCPACERDKYDGHAPDCALSAALAAKGE